VRKTAAVLWLVASACVSLLLPLAGAGKRVSADEEAAAGKCEAGRGKRAWVAETGCGGCGSDEARRSENMGEDETAVER
jgi:hypothetical protein